MLRILLIILLAGSISQTSFANESLDTTDKDIPSIDNGTTNQQTTPDNPDETTAATNNDVIIPSIVENTAPTAIDTEKNPTAPVFSITTTGFLDEGALPVIYTCDGKNISPQFSWSNPPEKTSAFAIVATDSDNPSDTWFHWILYNIPANTDNLDEGTTLIPQGSKLGKNSWGNTSYEGPCPPKGTVHSYEFTLYALNQPIEVSKDQDNGTDLLKLIKQNSLGSTKQTAVYARWNS